MAAYQSGGIGVIIHKKYSVTAVAAMAKNRVIGDGDKMPWNLPSDLQRVKARTMGRPLIMGRRTFLSIGRALPGRGTIVMTRQQDWRPEIPNPASVITATSPQDALDKAADWIAAETGRSDEIIIFGGGEIYRIFLPYTDRIDLTEVDLSPEGSVYFPDIDPHEWVLESAKNHDGYKVMDYRRKI